MGRKKELEIGEDYRKYFEGLLRFDSLETAEKTLTELDELLKRFSRENDELGKSYCTQLARLGKQRALGISKNARVESKKRLEKEEIAQWFTIWLQTPDLFFDWLALRKQTEEFISKFGPH